MRRCVLTRARQIYRSFFERSLFERKIGHGQRERYGVECDNQKSEPEHIRSLCAESLVVCRPMKAQA